MSLQWRQNGRDSVSNHQPRECLLNRLIRCRSKKTPKLRVTGLCVGNSSETSEFPAQRASNAENVSIWWRHHVNSCNGPERGLSKVIDKHTPHPPILSINHGLAWLIMLHHWIEWIPTLLIMLTSSNGNIFRVTGPLCEEFIGHRWIPRTKASDAGFWCFLWSRSEPNSWANNGDAGDLRRRRANYDVTLIIRTEVNMKSRDHIITTVGLCWRHQMETFYGSSRRKSRSSAPLFFSVF